MLGDLPGLRLAKFGVRSIACMQGHLLERELTENFEGNLVILQGEKGGLKTMFSGNMEATKCPDRPN